ncbi:MAG TPA: ornithine cyclodeaminase family protein [Steroidobacteraceae bacterium]|nr:ornithine cyclodeaminase family protein [Steroidobacteraceae bacterium]
MIRYLNEAEVRAALNWSDLIVAMERALTAFSSGAVLQPLRTWLTLEEGERYWGIMPAATREAMGLKLVSFYPRNAGSDIPTVIAIVLLVRPDTGEPLAMLDGRTLTAMRTAAVSAAVTNRLASRESRVLAFLGSGLQAETHLQALAHVRNFDEVRVWSRTPDHAERFAARHGARAMDAESAVRGADVIVTATPAREPILKGAWLKPGAHVNAIGAPMPSWRELDDEAMANTLVVESREAARHESGDVILSKARIYAEAGEIFAGKKTIAPSATTVFKSVGMAVEDVAAAKLVLDASMQRE